MRHACLVVFQPLRDSLDLAIPLSATCSCEPRGLLTPSFTPNVGATECAYPQDSSKGGCSGNKV